MNLFYQSAFLQALGWSLVDSLWQMGLLWVGYSLLSFNGSRFNAAQRHTLAVLALFSGFAWFIASIGFNYYAINNGDVNYKTFDTPGIIYRLTPYLSSAYLLMIVFFVIKWTIQYRSSQLAYDRESVMPAFQFEALLEELKRLTGIKKDVRIWFSENITSPLTTGFLKPVILFPVAALNQLTTQQAESLIVHEFFHIKRNDYLVNLFISFADIVFFFNPFARLLKGIIGKEREHSCDDAVISLGFSRWDYVQALYVMGKHDAEDHRFALAATGKGKQLLLQRVKRMMNRGYARPSILKPTLAFFLCLLLAGSINRTTAVEEKIAVAQAKPEPSQIVRQVSEDKTPVFVKQTVIIENNTPVEKKHKVKITRLILRETSGASLTPQSTFDDDDAEQTEDIFIASYISNTIEVHDFSFVPAVTADFQKPESCSPSEPFLPNSTFYFPTHEVLKQENGKTTIRL